MSNRKQKRHQQSLKAQRVAKRNETLINILTGVVAGIIANLICRFLGI